jgi:hypothetical protein
VRSVAARIVKQRNYSSVRRRRRRRSTGEKKPLERNRERKFESKSTCIAFWNSNRTDLHIGGHRQPTRGGIAINCKDVAFLMPRDTVLDRSKGNIKDNGKNFTRIGATGPYAVIRFDKSVFSKVNNAKQGTVSSLLTRFVSRRKTKNDTHNTANGRSPTNSSTT